MRHRVEIRAKLSFSSVLISHKIKFSFAMIFIVGLAIIMLHNA